MDKLDHAIINELQNGFPICARPYREVGERLGTTEEVLIDRLRQLLEAGMLSRFGPMYHAERLGGGLSLCAMRISPADIERVAAQVNAYPEVAHNYVREHELNMWFVLATERPERIAGLVREIEESTGYAVYNMPKLEEFYIGLRFEV
jgi:DNA-binding Lrp family transcriptional regulator